MPWYIEKDTGQECRRKAQGVCLTPHYGEDEAAANRAARKKTKNDPHGNTFVAVYLIPLDKKEEKLLLQKARKERRRMLIAAAAGLAGGIPPRRDDPPFLRAMGDAKKIDNGDGTITLVDGDGTPRLVVGKNMHDQVVAVDIESMTTGELMRAARRSTGSPPDLGSLLLEAAQGGKVVVLPRIECGHPTPDGPCCRLQGHVSKTHLARMPATPEAKEDEGLVDTGSTAEVTNKASSTLVVGDLAFFEPKAYFDVHSSYPEAMLRPVDPRFRLKGLGKKKP